MAIDKMQSSDVSMLFMSGKGKEKQAVFTARPFLKWAGGKQQLLQQFEAHFPAGYRRYIEPFVGGGAVFFHLWNTRRLPEEIYLFDSNPELINAYGMVRDKVEELIRLLSIHQKKHSKEYYYQIRSLDRRKTNLNDVERAARTIYLNKTCYNGLYRVNRKGQFNVPMGRYKNPQILNEALLRTAHAALQGVCIQTRHFSEMAEFARPGDFFYFDPPYDPMSKTASFTGYTAGNFDQRDQRELAALFTHLTRKGCFCMLSNASTPFILELYRDYRIERVRARRAVNSRAQGRGYVSEVLVLNY